MKLGNYVEFLTAVPNLAEAAAFYEKLGFKKITDHLYSDGCFNLHLQAGDFISPTLHYMGSERNDEITTPEGVRIVLSTQPGTVEMPTGAPLERQPISRCGKFGEFALSVENFKVAAETWSKLGFEQVYASEEPYPWGIFSDGMMVVGLHEHVSFGNEPQVYTPTPPHITYFAGDMADKITAFKSEGLEIGAIPPMVDGISNAEMTGPGGVKFFLFTGEI